MKTQIFKTVFKVVALAVMTLGLANCSKDSGSKSSTNSGYQWMNGQCYQLVNGQNVYQSNQNLCNTNTTNSGYQWINGQCFQIVNGQQIYQSNQSLCNNTGTTSGYQWMNGQCYQLVNGQYIYQSNQSLCNNTGTNTGSTQVCSGYYSDGMQTALCTPGASGIQYQNGYIVMNCSGYRLYNQQYQLVQCQ